LELSNKENKKNSNTKKLLEITSKEAKKIKK